MAAQRSGMSAPVAPNSAADLGNAAGPIFHFWSVSLSMSCSFIFFSILLSPLILETNRSVFFFFQQELLSASTRATRSPLESRPLAFLTERVLLPLEPPLSVTSSRRSLVLLLTREESLSCSETLRRSVPASSLRRSSVPSAVLRLRLSLWPRLLLSLDVLLVTKCLTQKITDDFVLLFSAIDIYGWFFVCLIDPSFSRPGIA